mgnify:CR=1 FL=1
MTAEAAVRSPDSRKKSDNNRNVVCYPVLLMPAIRAENNPPIQRSLQFHNRYHENRIPGTA